MEPSILVYGIIALVALLIGTICALIVYSGVFEEIVVGAGKPPIKNVHVAYKFGRGAYVNTGNVFTEVTCLAPKSKSFGVYYDDPKQVPENKLRWAVGCILKEGGVDSVEESQVQAFEKEGYKFFDFPEVSNAVRTKFPFKSSLSIFVGVYRVYPMLGQYVVENRLCAHPWMEIYDNDTIHYMAPLAKQDEFYVPESDVADEEDADNTESNVDDESQLDSSVDRSMSRGAQSNMTDKTVDEESILEKLVDNSVDETGDHVKGQPRFETSFTRFQMKASTPQPQSSCPLEKDLLSKNRAQSLGVDTMHLERLKNASIAETSLDSLQSRDSSSDFDLSQTPTSFSTQESSQLNCSPSVETDTPTELSESETSKGNKTSDITEELSIPGPCADTCNLSDVLPDPLVCDTSRLAEYSDAEEEMPQDTESAQQENKEECTSNGQPPPTSDNT